MNYEEAAKHVGERVIYTPVTGEPGLPGRIRKMQQLPLVDFDNGTTLQVNPYNLELADAPPTLFGH